MTIRSRTSSRIFYLHFLINQDFKKVSFDILHHYSVVDIFGRRLTSVDQQKFMFFHMRIENFGNERTGFWSICLSGWK